MTQRNLEILIVFTIITASVAWNLILLYALIKVIEILFLMV